MTGVIYLMNYKKNNIMNNFSFQEILLLEIKIFKNQILYMLIKKSNNKMLKKKKIMYSKNMKKPRYKIH
jgi:hypothetical protein